jgi:LacI family transcriptional regulator
MVVKVKKSNPPTIREIARLVGVSVNTVSRALNNKPDVSPETKKNIIKTAQLLNYTPNAIARALVQRSTRTIGMVMSDISDPFFGEMVKDAEVFFRSRGYNLILCNTQENFDQEKHSIETLINKRVDGILLTPVGRNGENLQEILKNRVPLVLLGRHFDEPIAPSVTSNDERGGYLATQHLLELGHHKILFINVFHHISSAHDRFLGYQKALREFGIDYDESLLIHASFDLDDVYQKTKKFFYQSGKVTAVIVFCDILAISVMKAVIDVGLTIPRDISIVGFDNINISSLLPIPLTTIDPNKKKMVETASELLLEAIRLDNIKAGNLSIEPTLTIRSSTMLSV